MSRSAAATEKWRGIVDEQTSSGQTVAEYCRRHGIAASSLFAWKRRLRRATEGTAFAMTAPTFVEAKVRPEDDVCDESGGEAFPSQAAEGAASASIEIHLPGRRRILVRPGFNSTALGEVVKTLEGMPSRETLA